jgi:arylsulfatase A-like enzyme
LLSGGSLVAASVLSAIGLTNPAQAQQPAPAPAGQRPNIVVIMGDDIGIWNLGAYHRGMMAGRTPNLDKVAAEGMLFTDYYAEASCTAGRANFITGELPIRTGMTTVGQAGAPTGIPAQAVTIATALKGMGYATGQFGKNHLGDKNEDMGVDDNTIVVFTTDNGTEVFTWPDGGQTPFAQSKGTVFEGGVDRKAVLMQRPLIDRDPLPRAF